MSAPGDQHVPVLESQPRALVFQDRVEGYCRAITVLRGTGHLCLNFHGAVELLGKRGSTQGVELLYDVSVDLRLRNDIEDLARGIDDRSSGDADFRVDITAVQVRGAIDRGAPRGYQTYMRVERAGISVDRVHAVVLRRDIEH